MSGLIRWFLNSRLISFFMKLPLVLQGINASIIAYIIYIRMPYFQRKIKDNLAGIVPGDQIKYVARKVIIGFCRYLFEVAMLCRVRNKKRRAKLISVKKIRYTGLNNLDYELAKGSGVILVSANLGSYIWGVLGLLEKGYNNLKFAKQKNLVFNCEIQRKIENNGIVEKNTLSSPPSAFQFLKQNGILCIFFESWPDARLMPVNFLGNLTFISEIPISLALLTGASILPMFVVNRSQNTCEVIIEEALYLTPTKEGKKDVIVNMLRLCNRVEYYVRQYPCQWYNWVNFDKRWVRNSLGNFRVGNHFNFSKYNKNDKLFSIFSRETQLKREELGKVINLIKNKINQNDRHLMRILNIGLLGLNLMRNPMHPRLRKEFQDTVNYFLPELEE